MEKHTATPWEVQQLNHADGELWLQIGHNGWGPIVELNGGAVKMRPPWQGVAEIKYMSTPDEECKANAAFIVRACNAHTDLLAAAEAALLVLGPASSANGNTMDGRARITLEQAIAKAKE